MRELTALYKTQITVSSNKDGDESNFNGKVFAKRELAEGAEDLAGVQVTACL